MKNCRKIQPDLSAYLDGELTPSLRAKVEDHLASCAECRQELSEMKILATGVAALPNLKPAPRFLTEVRRKIARGEKPEPLTWQDYIFHPIWLKVPLEIAALIMIIGLVIQGEHPAPTQPVARLETTGEENRQNVRENGVASSTPANQAPAAEPAWDAAKAELSESRLVLEKKEKDVTVGGTPSPPVAIDEKRSLDQFAAGDGNYQPEVHAQKTLALQDKTALSATRQPSDVSGFGSRSDRAVLSSKPGETITVHGRGFEDVRSQAQRLAARCGGQLVVIPSLQNATDQVFFVELPREYVAAFKLELMKSPGTPAISATDAANEQAGTTDQIARATGVLTGSMLTNNNSINAPGSLGLGDDATTPAATTVLEIRVVAPAN